jgi:flagellar biosynthesis protein FliR
MNDLETFLTTGVFAFLLCFVRLGTAVMLMPGVGTSFVPPNVRLYFALGFALVLMPVVQAKLPNPLPSNFAFVILILAEFIVGLFIGTVARILMSALDTAGMIISMQSSLSNAQLFNPAFAAQGSIVGGFVTLAGISLLFATDLHHLFLLGIINSYTMFPVGEMPDMGSMSEVVVRSVASAFAVGVQMTAPFLIIIVLMYVAMGVMTKLMPQVQVFMIAIPVQILLCLIMLALVVSALMLVWLTEYQKGMSLFTGGG